MARVNPRTANQEYSIGEAAKFLDRSIYWVREAENSGDFVEEDGTPIEPIRTHSDNPQMGQRRYTLDMIEKMVSFAIGFFV